MTYDVSFIPERPEERELAGALDRFSAECMEHGGDAGGPYLTNQDGVEQAGREVAVAVTALLGRADHIGDAADMMPLTLEQLRKMDGQPVWVTPSGFWALVIAKKGQRVQLICNDGEKVWADKEIELVGPVYAYPPAHIDREAWTAEWIKCDGYTECSKCEHWYDSPESEDDGDRPAFCPHCGRAMTPEAWAELEKRLRG